MCSNIVRSLCRHQVENGVSRDFICIVLTANQQQTLFSAKFNQVVLYRKLTKP